MGLRKTTCHIQAQGLGASTKIRFTGTVIATLLSRIEPTFVMRCSMHVIPKITAYLPTKSITREQIAATSKLDLADQQFHRPAKIEILLGAGVWAEIIKGEVEKHASGLTAQYTSFGWILFGQMRANPNPAKASRITMLTTESPDEHLNELLRKFWEVEELHSPTPMSAEDEWVEQNFQDTHWRGTSGRYVVTIPINPQAQGLGSSRAVAVRRFYHLEKRLSVNSELKEKYVDFMREYEQLGHMAIATSEPKSDGDIYHIPHHCVSKKFRVVFDASCKSDNGISLNDLQFPGPKLQDDLSVILTRFRSYKVAVNADVRKMFRQVRVDPKQWDLQRIFWREIPNEDLHEYWLTVVTYGMASSGFNAVRAMIQCARDNKEAYPLAHQAITTNFYMDDMLTGADTEQVAVDLAKEIVASLKTGGFELDKFASSSARVRSAFVNTVSDNTEHAFPAEPKTSILGLYCNPSTDELHFKVHQSDAESKITKRAVVSTVARLYDPNGYLAPVIIRAKIIIQDLWRSGVHWDNPIPVEYEPTWRKFKEQLEHLTSVRLSRWLGSEEARSLELHGFADASERAYAAVVYLRSSSADVGTKCTLVASKTRVAPLKTITIPRLELCAADLLCKLMSQVIQAGSFQNVTRIYWSDSMVALHWIAKLPYELKPFVSNRVKSIQQFTSGHPWRHVKSADNPADLGSRGITAEQLKDAKLWWQGPPWLSKAEQHWPTMPIQLSAKQKERAEKEAKAITIVSLTITTSQSLDIDGIALIDRLSTFQSVIRITAFVLRFVRNLKQHEELRPHRTMSHVPVLSVVERERDLTYWVKSAEQEAYRDELREISKNEPVDQTSNIKTLSPFLDSEGVIRVGGRLQAALIPYQTMHQMILPPKSRISYLIMREAHLTTHHGGVQLCTQYIRQRFWITTLRRALKCYIGRCIVCFRQKGAVVEQMMGSLPQDRVQPARAFRHSGVDYAGPVEIKARAGRSKITEKGYIAVFVCLVTRAIHLELVSNQTTEAFLAAFQRFTGRRGACSVLWSDNVTTFVGADRELRRRANEWTDRLPIEQINKMGTEWKFITPGAPHTGGIWEAGVKSVKHHLRRIMGKQIFTFETLATTLVLIEACLNSRPVSALSDDPDDLSALTPGQFLIGEQIVQPLRADFTEVPQNRLSLWNSINQMQQHFWTRWQHEYLNTLQQRFKWNQRRENINVGDLVLIKHENMPPTVWPLGRITSIHLGADGLVRSAEVRTEHTTLARPVQKLCVLPKDNEHDTN